ARGRGLGAERDVEVQGRLPSVAGPAPPLDRPRPRLRDVEVYRHDRIEVTVADRAITWALLRVQARLAVAGPAFEEYGADEQVRRDIGGQRDPAPQESSSASGRLLCHARVRQVPFFGRSMENVCWASTGSGQASASKSRIAA